MVRETKLYQILDVNPTASASEIKKAYHQKALQCHPDKELDPEKKKAKELHFKEISEAYAILSDPAKRQNYDQFGINAAQHDQPETDIFSNLFGGGRGHPFFGHNPFFGGGGDTKPAKTKVQAIIQEIEITMKESFTGVKKNISLNCSRTCSKCQGLGVSNPDAILVCQKCQGKGMFTIVKQIGPMISRQSGPCQDCQGAGKAIDPKQICQDCRGSKIKPEKKTLTVTIPPGCQDGQQVIFENDGNQHPDADLNGDIVVVVHVKNEPSYQRVNNNLCYLHKISLVDVLCGSKIVIPHLDGRLIILRQNQSFDPNKRYIVQNEGFPYAHGLTGDLIISFQVLYPDKLSETAVNQLKLALNYQQPPDISPEHDFFETTLVEYIHTNRPSSSNRDDSQPTQCTTQ